MNGCTEQGAEKCNLTSRPGGSDREIIWSTALATPTSQGRWLWQPEPHGCQLCSVSWAGCRFHRYVHFGKICWAEALQFAHFSLCVLLQWKVRHCIPALAMPFLRFFRSIYLQTTCYATLFYSSLPLECKLHRERGHFQPFFHPAFHCCLTRFWHVVGTRCTHIK